MNRSIASLVGIVGFLALLAAGYFWFIPLAEEDLTIKAEARIVAAGIELNQDGAIVDFDGRIGTVTGKQAEAGLAAVRTDVPGAEWNRAEVIEVATEPSMKMKRSGTLSVTFEGAVGTEEEKEALFAAAEEAGFDVVDQLRTDPTIEASIDGVEQMVLPLLTGADNAEVTLTGDLIEITATAKDPVESEAIDTAVSSVEDNGWNIRRNLDAIVLPESVQIERLQEEIDQIFELARGLRDKSPNFETSAEGLEPSATAVLDRVVVLLRRYPLPNADVVGHTDNVGDAAANQILSEERATAVADYLEDSGIRTGRITPIGQGEIEPIISNETEAGRKANRRVSFVVGRSGN